MLSTRPRRLPPPLLAAGLVAVLIVALAAWWWVGSRRSSTAPGPGRALTGHELVLYIAAAGGDEYATRPLQLGTDLTWVDQIKAVVAALVTQPSQAGQPSLWPFSLNVRSAYRLTDGVLVLDLEEGVKYNQGASATKELQVVRSVVRTLTHNFPNLRQVKFLINGAEEETLAGHVDITRPLGPED